MAWQELLALFQGNPTESPDAVISRLITKLDELLAALEALELAEDDKAGPALIRVKWRASGFSQLPLEELEKSTARTQRNRLRNLRKNLQATLGKLTAEESLEESTEIHEARESLLSSRRELELLSGGFREDARRTRIVRGALLLAPVLLGGAALYYLRTDRGLRVEQIEAIAPSGAYTPLANGTLPLRPEYLTDYMNEFSKYYFGHPSQFESIYYDHREPTKDGKDPKEPKDAKDPKEPKDAKDPKDLSDATAQENGKRRTLQHKISLRNVSQGHAAYLSSIEAIVDVTEKVDFPWSRLNVTPHVAANPDAPSNHRSLLIKSDGIGPALDVRETLITGSGLLLSKHETPILHRAAILPFQHLVLQYVAVSDADGRLAAPLYHHLNTPPTTPGPQYFELKAPKAGELTADKLCTPSQNSADFGFWEEIRSVSRLRQVTPAAYAEPYTLEVRYASLKGPQETLHFGGRLDPSEAFYTANDRLRDQDPRCLKFEHDTDNLVEAAAPTLERLAFFFAPEKELTYPKGTDLIAARLGIDLQGLTIGRHVGATQPIDGFLNPQGVLAINLTLNTPPCARYEVRVLVNGSLSTSYRFDALAPEFLTFAEEGPNLAVPRLRRVFELEQQRLGPAAAK